MTQQERVIDYLIKGKTFIFELRKIGHQITTNRVEVNNQFGESCLVADYKLVEL